MTRCGFPRGTARKKPNPSPNIGAQLTLLFARFARKKGSDKKPGAQLRSRTFSGIINNMEGKEKTTRHGSLKRPHRLEVTFSDREWQAVQALASKAGTDKIAAVVRNLVLCKGTVIAAITAEDRRNIAQLSKIGTNLWQLRKELLNWGVDDSFLRDLETFRAEFQNIISSFREKIEKQSR